MITAQTETDLLVGLLQMLERIAEKRTTYDSHWREQTDFSGLAAALLMADELAMGEPATIPDSLRVEIGGRAAGSAVLRRLRLASRLHVPRGRLIDSDLPDRHRARISH